MAAQRLQNLEKRLSRQPEIAEEHTRIIGEHIKKRYITKLPPVEDDKIVKWYLITSFSSHTEGQVNYEGLDCI